MNSAEVPAVIFIPESWVITPSRRPTLLQRVHCTTVITQNLRIYTYLPPAILFDIRQKKRSLSSLKSSTDSATLDFLI